MLIPLGFLAGSGGVEGDYELIESYVLGSAQTSVTFSSLGTYSSTYKHLQVRYTARASTGGSSLAAVYSRLNGDSGSNYSLHNLFGNGSSVSSSATAPDVWALSGLTPLSGVTANVFSATVIDLLDPYSTTKNKTFRTLSGIALSGINRIDLQSGNWRNTSAITSWEILSGGSNSFAIGSRFSLYGIKG